ncbi:hypothetical protein HY989_00285 [Candidatus Micrarchaeota archaeon]|nr:hypothetical protein [Candidatus Micrarchaeota archaeon]
MNSKAQVGMEYILLLAALILLAAGIYSLSRSNIIAPSGISISNTSGNTGNVFATVGGSAPIISNLNVTNGPGISEVTITWDTNIASTSTVNYGVSSNLGTLLGSNTVLQKHSVKIKAQAGTYFYKVTSCDPAGTCASSAIETLTI